MSDANAAERRAFDRLLTRLAEAFARSDAARRAWLIRTFAALADLAEHLAERPA